MVSKEKMQEIAEELQGTCKDLDTVLEEHGIDVNSIPQERFQDLDEITEQCEACGWWCEPFEMECGICGDCRDE